MEWRKKWKADTIYQDYKVPEVLKKYYPGGWAGYDKEGCPVWMMQSGHFDMKGKLLSVLQGFHAYFRQMGISGIHTQWCHFFCGKCRKCGGWLHGFPALGHVLAWIAGVIKSIHIAIQSMGGLTNRLISVKLCRKLFLTN